MESADYARVCCTFTEIAWRRFIENRWILSVFYGLPVQLRFRTGPHQCIITVTITSVSTGIAVVLIIIIHVGYNRAPVNYTGLITIARLMYPSK